MDTANLRSLVMMARRGTLLSEEGVRELLEGVEALLLERAALSPPPDLAAAVQAEREACACLADAAGPAAAPLAAAIRARGSQPPAPQPLLLVASEAA